MADHISFGGSSWTERNEDRGFAEWHRGRPWYYFWCVMIRDDGWARNVASAARYLSDYLVPGYQRQPHVTLLPAGFPSGVPLDAGDVVHIARRCTTFDMALGPLTSFSAAPCLAVQDEGDKLCVLREQLRHIMIDPDSVISDTRYQPHLTVGLYRDRFSTGDISRRIAGFRAEATGTVQVNGFSLARYRTGSIKGPIEAVATFELESGRYSRIMDTGILT